MAHKSKINICEVFSRDQSLPYKRKEKGDIYFFNRIYIMLTKGLFNKDKEAFTLLHLDSIR